MSHFIQPELFQQNEYGSLQSVYVGCAGWSISSVSKEFFPQKGSHLERYAQVFPAVEINSSFYRPHREVTYARWRDSVPESFRFSVKMPRMITHTMRLQRCEQELASFLQSVSHLHEKLGCLLVQLPPSFQYSESSAKPFFEMLRAAIEIDIVCEPRHPTWFSMEAIALLDALRIAYVEADPQIVMKINESKFQEVIYLRLHGSPVIYHSSYPAEYLHSLSERLLRESASGRRVWCVFDNTASGAAIQNALWTLNRL